MSCSNCGTKLTKKDVYCPGCGKKTIKKEKPAPKYSISAALATSLVLAAILYIIPILVSVICYLGNIDGNDNFVRSIYIMQYIGPIVVMLFMPWILYIVKNNQNT